MKYEKEYKITNNKYEFVQLLLEKYVIKKTTAERRYYDCKKKFGSKEKKVYTPKIHPDEITQPSHQRMLEFEDMKRLNISLTKENLLRYGFLEYEINWLKENKKI